MSVRQNARRSCVKMKSAWLPELTHEALFPIYLDFGPKTIESKQFSRLGTAKCAQLTFHPSHECIAHSKYLKGWLTAI